MKKHRESLLSYSPELAAQWNDERNGDLGPGDIARGSRQKVWWKCINGHEWETSVSSRTGLGTGCPYCSGQKAIIGVNDLATIHPELLGEWNYEKNNVSPQNVLPKSEKKIWWKCSNGHEWQAVVHSRTNGTGCPYCAGKIAIRGVNDLATVRPDLAEQWNYERNRDLLPSQFMPQSSRKVWWKCKLGHEWESNIANRYKGRGCPYCGKRTKVGQKKRLLVGYSDLATTHPEIAKDWNYERNNGLTPQDVTAGTNKKVWWRCYKGHEYQAVIFNKTRPGRHGGCPICNRERHTSFPEQAIFYYIKQYFHDAVNSDTDAIGMELDIYIPSQKIAVEYDGSAWHSGDELEEREQRKNILCQKKGILLIRIREDGREEYEDCAVCVKWKGRFSESELSGLIITVMRYISSELVPDIDVVRDSVKIYDQYMTRDKESSLAEIYPKIAKEWCYEKNGKTTPDMVSSHSGKKFWWKCSKGHLYYEMVNARTGSKKINCPYCANHRVLAGYNDLTTTNPEIAKEWNYEKNSKLTPNRVVAGSNRKVWWRCSACGNEWQAAINSRTMNKTGCPVCSYKRIGEKLRTPTIGVDDLASCYPEIAREWDYNKNKLKPEDIKSGSNQKVWWICPKGHSYSKSIVGRIKSNGCPYCANVQVLIGFNDLTVTFPNIAAEWNYEKNGSLLPQNVVPGSGKRVWWKCAKGHEWQTAIRKRTGDKTGCPYCSGHKVCAGLNDLATVIPDLAAEWDYDKNNGLSPSDVTKASSKIVWWLCPEGHSYKSKIENRSILREGCPECRKLKVAKALFKAVRCVETGVVYESIKATAESVHVSSLISGYRSLTMKSLLSGIIYEEV